MTALAETPADAEAGQFVHAVVQAVEQLADAVHDPIIREALSGLDALALEKTVERIGVIVEEIDHHAR